MSRPFDSSKESEHNGVLNASGTFLIDRYSTKDQPRIINLVDTKNFKETVNLLTAKDPYEGYQMPSIETFRIGFRCVHIAFAVHHFIISPVDDRATGYAYFEYFREMPEQLP